MYLNNLKPWEMYSWSKCIPIFVNTHLKYHFMCQFNELLQDDSRGVPHFQKWCILSGTRQAWLERATFGEKYTTQDTK